MHAHLDARVVRHSSQWVDVSNARQEIDVGVLVSVRNRDHAGSNVRVYMGCSDDLSSFTADDHLLSVGNASESRIGGVKQYVGGGSVLAVPSIVSGLNRAGVAIAACSAWAMR